MSDLKLARNEPETLLWRELEQIRAGMLGVVGSGQHLQPMAFHGDRAGRALWFLTKRDTDLAQAAGSGAEALFVAVSKDQDFHVSMMGALAPQHDPAVLDEMWNPVAAAWYQGGKDDPELLMLRLRLRSAAIWASTDSKAAFAWEIAKANATDAEPDVGVRNEVAFA